MDDDENNDDEAVVMTIVFRKFMFQWIKNHLNIKLFKGTA